MATTSRRRDEILLRSVRYSQMIVRHFHKLPMPRADELAYIVVRVLVKPTRTHTKTKTIVSVQQ